MHRLAQIVFLSLLFLQIIFLQKLHAQEDIHFIHYGIKEGLSQSTVLSSYQDAYGFLWFGTRDGLNRFDGYNFEVYKNSPTDTNAIAGNYILDITGDSLGNLWIATDQGLSFFQRNNHRFINFIVPYHEKDSEVSSLLIDNDGNIWVGTKDGLFIFSQKDEAFAQPVEFPITKKIQKDYVLCIFEDQSNGKWVGTTDGLYFQPNNSKDIYRFHPDNSGEFYITHPRVEKVMQDSLGMIWAGTYGGGVSCIDPERGFINSLNDSNVKPGAITNNFVRDLFLDESNRLWIGTFQGLNIYDISKGKNTQIRYDQDLSNGLSHGSIRSISGLTDGSVVVGTYFGGVSYYNKYNQKFSHLKNIPDKPETLSFNVVSSFEERDSNYIWIGTERGGLNILNKNTGDFRAFSFNKGMNSLSSHTIKSLMQDDSGTLWIGTFKGGLNSYNPNQEKFSRYPALSQKQYAFLSNTIVNDIIEDRDGFLWIATDRYGGLYKLDKNSGKFIDFQLSDSIHNLLENTNVKSLLQDRFGNLWLSTFGKGVILYNEKEHFVHTIGTKAKDFLNINHLDVNQVFEDNDGLLWIATNGGGINILDRKENQINILTTSDGLLSNTIFNIMEDKDANIWISSANGLTRYNKSSASMKIYTYQSGLPIEEINVGSLYLTANNELFVGGNNGIIYFFPSKLRDNPVVPNVIITDFKLFNQSVLPGDGTKILEKSIFNTKTIKLNHHQSIFSIEFTALNYLFPQNNKYKYMLEGLEENWNEVDEHRLASYTNLKDGRYLFKVKASNNDAIWNEIPTELEIIILPPKWKTWWASIIYLSLTIAGIFLLRSMTLKRARLKRNLYLKELENTKLEEINTFKQQFFIDVSHEIRTPLTLIVDPLEQIIQSGEGSSWLRNMLRTMHQNSRRMLLLINQILELSQLEHGKQYLTFGHYNLGIVMGNIVDSFKVLADKTNIKFQYQPNIGKEIVKLDRDKIEKIFYNLLSNAFKFCKPGGKVEVLVNNITEISATESRKSTYEFIISDTGIGIEEKEIDKIFERFYKANTKMKGSGVGLALVKSLVNTLNGEIKVMSHPSSGTQFKVVLPFEKVDHEVSAKNSDDNEFLRQLPPEYYFDLKPSAEEQFDIKHTDNHSIVIVEDDPGLSQYLIKNLKGKFHLEVRSDGMQALELIKKLNPDMVITDIMLPGMDGISLCKSIKKDVILSHIPVIILTAKSSDQDRIECLEAGADAFLGKPFIMKELLARINNILFTREKLRERYSREVMLSPREVTLNSYDEKLLEKIMQIIEKYISDPALSVDFLGDKVGLSRVHLYRKLKALTNLSPSDFIRDFRLKRAANLLSQNKINVTDIAFMVGFQDLNYFGKAFKKAYGFSPTEYAKRAAGNNSFK